MARKYGYSKGTVTSLFNPDGRSKFDMEMDGYRYTNVQMCAEILRYLRGPGRGVEHTVYWMANRKSLLIMAVKTENGDTLSETMTARHWLTILGFMAPAMGFLTWFATWVPFYLLAIFLYGQNGAMDTANLWAICAGLAVTAYRLKDGYSLITHQKNFIEFQEGDVRQYGKKEFGVSSPSRNAVTD
ncbi:MULTISPECIES: hypothetical protein [Pseudomonas]|uniref:hypothetical protein n=1 Tax=Pseudomonas TaxID=286 RepID=UPI0015FBABB8|nr:MULTISPECIES: hypothetical protein [Pseudomonas]MBA6138196.1 hypothetical protein [Pseudomonas monteilii]MCE0908777.1 hypothetical protein [Pseudomonas kurunegalensis]MDT3747718.1 hypothetical protein [Pseudomonas kurunegalensis]WJR57889.1 hypothetical protein LU664_010140 [Pseudomonas kurunegalensis]